MASPAAARARPSPPMGSMRKRRSTDGGRPDPAAESVEIEPLDERGVGVGLDVGDDRAVVVLVGVEVVKGEERVGGDRLGCLPGRAVNEKEAGAALRLPLEVLGIGATAERELERIDDPGELGEDDEPLGEPERVDVAGPLDPNPRDHLRLIGIRREEKEAVLIARAELGGVVQHPVRRSVAMGVRGRDQARRGRTAHRRPRGSRDRTGPRSAPRSSTDTGLRDGPR